MQTVAVVANPTKLDDVEAVRAALSRTASEHDHRLLWLETSAEDPGRGQTRQALEQGAGLVCALGGDGTVRSVAHGLLGSRASLGLLPGGTGNLLALNLGLPTSSLDEAFVAALEGSDRAVDVGWVRLDAQPEEIFLVMSGMGLDAETMAGASEATKARIGWLAYGLSGLRRVATKGLHVRITSATGSWRQHARSVLVGNCGQVQGGVMLMPQAAVDDDQLDLLVFAPHGLLGWTAALWMILTRRRGGHPSVLHQAGRRFTVVSKRPALVQLDGDAVGECSRMDFRVEPAALRVRV
ncbi:diacylglycerol/lipid kinase family protein [Luteococcus peritonei]|uniref:Diacylglycerol/lipid kinase family protein n=1 Tax=Luteococcus peritonei TaxID=88874 RepID=A0ABW4RUP1_9ACTN